MKSGRFGHPEPARETVRSDSDDVGSWVWLKDDAISLTPEQLLERGLDLLRERDKQIHKLLRHLPRKFEDKVRALDDPKAEAFAAIEAAGILLGNVRHALAAPDYPERKKEDPHA